MHFYCGVYIMLLANATRLLVHIILQLLCIIFEIYD